MSETTAAPLIKDTIDVTCDNGDVFYFRVPSPREYARMLSRAYEMRRQDSPNTGGSDYGLDFFAQDLYKGFALFETLLTKADAKDNWPYSENAAGKPVVDSTKFPPVSIQLVPEAYRKFEEAFATFLSGGV